MQVFVVDGARQHALPGEYVNIIAALPDVRARDATHAATATMYDPVDVKYYSNGR